MIYLVYKSHEVVFMYPIHIPLKKMLPSGTLAKLLNMTHSQLVNLSKMVIFHSYDSLPEGIARYFP